MIEIQSKVCEKTTGTISILLEKFTTAWNEKDTDCLAALFTENAEFTDISGQVITGREGIRKMFDSAFAGNLKKASLKLSGIYARALSDQLVIITGKWEMTEVPGLKPNSVQTRNGILQIVVDKTTENGYRIVLVHKTDLAGIYDPQEKEAVNIA